MSANSSAAVPITSHASADKEIPLGRQINTPPDVVGFDETEELSDLRLRKNLGDAQCRVTQIPSSKRVVIGPKKEESAPLTARILLV